MRSIKLLVFICLVGSHQAYSQQDISVFKIGEDAIEYEALSSVYKGTLMEVYDNSIEASYSRWIEVMEEFETYAKKAGVNLHGIKLWINVYWSANGQIEHIAFHEKPNSKLMDYEKIRQLLQDYLVLSTKSKSYSYAYAHYGSISFPVLRLLQQTTVK